MVGNPAWICLDRHRAIIGAPSSKQSIRGACPISISTTYLNRFAAEFLLRLISASSDSNVILCTYPELFSGASFVPNYSLENGVAFDVRRLALFVRRVRGYHNKRTQIGCIDDDKAIGCVQDG